MKKAGVIQLANMTMSKTKQKNCQRNRVYSVCGIAPTLCTDMGGGGNLVPLIIPDRAHEHRFIMMHRRYGK